MQVKLMCPCCEHSFRMPRNTRVYAAVDSLTEQGPWSSLGDGQTFEDSLYSALTSDGMIRCPRCGGAVPVSEEVLGQTTLELLAQW